MDRRAIQGEMGIQPGKSAAGGSAFPFACGISPKEHCGSDFVILRFGNLVENEEQVTVLIHQALPTYRVSQALANRIGEIPSLWDK
jgi:hypothetical protein